MHLDLGHPSLVSVVSALLGALALASACGLRAFLPLLALSLASRAGLVHLDPHAAWIGADAGLWTLALAAALEIAGDKVPIVDHALDVIGTFSRPAAAAVVGWAAFGTVDPTLAAVAAIVLGGTALGVHAIKAKLRLGSTIATLGHANPLLSIGEDLTAGLLSAGAILAPVVIAAIAGTAVLYLVLHRRSA